MHYYTILYYTLLLQYTVSSYIPVLSVDKAVKLFRHLYLYCSTKCLSHHHTYSGNSDSSSNC